MDEIPPSKQMNKIAICNSNASTSIETCIPLEEISMNRKRVVEEDLLHSNHEDPSTKPCSSPLSKRTKRMPPVPSISSTPETMGTSTGSITPSIVATMNETFAEPPETLFLKQNPTKGTLFLDNKDDLFVCTSNHHRKLTNYENYLWSQTIAANLAAGHCDPSTIVRLLGAATRTVYVADPLRKDDDNKAAYIIQSKQKQTLLPIVKGAALQLKSKGKCPTITQIRKIITNTTLHDRLQKEESIIVNEKKLLNDWKTIHQRGTTNKTYWNTDGELLLPVQGTKASSSPSISCRGLLQLLQEGVLKEEDDNHLLKNDNNQEQQQKVKSLYNGLRKVKTDLQSFLTALIDFSIPDKKLYGVPLITTNVQSIPIFSTNTMQTTPTTENNNNIVIGYKLQFAVYAHRLLFEIMTQSLQTILESLDTLSGPIINPLRFPPPAPVVFDSDKTETVVYDKNETIHNDDCELTGEENNDSNNITKQQASSLLCINATKISNKQLYAFSNDGFLRLVENHGCNVKDYWDNNDNKFVSLSKRIQNKVCVQLMLHQIHGLCWMYEREQIPIQSLFWEQRSFGSITSSLCGTYYYSPAVGQVRLTLQQQQQQQQNSRMISPPTPNPSPLLVRGGILADEMGLGKTVQILALIVATLDDVKKEVVKHRNGNHATLIIVPPSLLYQWQNEIIKITGNSLVVDYLDPHTLTFNRMLDGPTTISTANSKGNKSNPDIVLTTYGSLDNTRCMRLLKDCYWGRVVLDEMQEIRSSATTIAKNCQILDSERRWMLSGTPLFQGIEDFKGELCFLQLEPFAATNDDGFFDFAIGIPWNQEMPSAIETLKVLSLILLRRSKRMTIRVGGNRVPRQLLDLPPMKIIYQQVEQYPSERALYYFMEFLVYESTKKNDDEEEEDVDEDNENNKKKKKKKKNNNINNQKMLLRQLCDFCVTPSLLNGGVGCPSRMNDLNRLLINYHRSNMKEFVPTSKDLSCSEAIIYLSQVADQANVDEDFVTSLTLGGGGGISQRQRAAVESADDKLKHSIEKSKIALQTYKMKKRLWLKSLWHSALERITTGAYSDYSRVTKQGIRWLWTVKGLQKEKLEQEKKDCCSDIRINAMHRGWRPSNRFFDTVCHNRLRLLRPNSIILRDIPNSVGLEDILTALRISLGCTSVSSIASNGDCEGLVINACRASSSSSSTNNSTWTGYVQLRSKEDMQVLNGKVKLAFGIKVKCPNRIQWLEDKISTLRKALVEATDANKVYPCTLHKDTMKDVRKELSKAQLGLRIFAKGQKNYSPGHIILEPAMGSIRSINSETNTQFVSEFMEQVKLDMYSNLTIHKREQEKIKHLQEYTKSRGLTDKVQALSAFESLLAMKNGHHSNTECAICLYPFCTAEGNSGTISLTRCGHLFCKECLDEYITKSERIKPPCVTCRKPLDPEYLVQVDPKKRSDEDELYERRSKAKALVHQVAEQLEKSNGQLEGHLWAALYYACDAPIGANSSPHNKLPAIPGHVLAHLRKATGMEPHCHASFNLGSQKTQFSSKINQLLLDLPKDEDSVVFAPSQQAVHHVHTVLNLVDIGCRVLFTGQPPEQMEKAVNEWQTIDSVRVLVVQSGAAACGLTLTSANKMFILAPLIKHEEEKQAFARLHRIGQRKAVVCKVYYTPVSVESRLLEWRKKTSGSEVSDESVVYADAVTDDDYDEDEEQEEELNDESQTRFLLGLREQRENMVLTDIDP